MTRSRSRASVEADALCWFGATGDLGYKMTIPALYGMARHGRLDVPVIGVARGGATLDDLEGRGCARASTSTAASPMPRPSIT